MAKLKHYVNLHRKDLFVERGIDSKDRLGPGVFFKLKFKKPDGMAVTFRTVKWTGTPECTMFGATSTETAGTPQKFCSVCEQLVVRQNLDPADPQGLPGFKSVRGL